MEKKDLYLRNLPEDFCLDEPIELSTYCEYISQQLHKRYAGKRCIIIDMQEVAWDFPCEIIWVKEIKCEVEQPRDTGCSGRIDVIIESQEGKTYEYEFLSFYIFLYEWYDDVFDECIREEPDQITSHCSHLA